MGIDDLAMMANTPVNPHDADEAREADIDKAAASETMPPPKEKSEDREDTKEERVARRGQDPPAPEEH